MKDDGTVVLNGVEKKLEEVGKQGEKTKGILDSIVSGIGVGAGIAIFNKLQSAVTSVANAVPGMFNEFMRAADAMQTLSDRTGVSAEALQAWEFAGAGAGISANQMATAVQSMQRQIQGGSKETQKSVKDLGLSFKELASSNPEQQLNAVVGALAGIEDPAKKSAIAVQLLGRSGKQLVALGGDFKDLTEKAHKLGIVTSNEVVKAADDLGDTWGQVSMVLAGLRGNIVSFIVQSEPLHKFLEGLRDLFGQLSVWVGENQEELRQWVDAGVILAANALVVMIPIVKAVIAVIGFFVDQLIVARFGAEAFGKGLVATFQAASAAATGSFGKVKTILSNYTKDVLDLTKRQEDALKANASGFDKIQGFADKAGVAFAGLAREVGEADGKMHASKKTTEEHAGAFSALTAEAKAAAEALKAYIKALPGGEDQAKKIKMLEQAFASLGSGATEEQVSKIVEDLNSLGDQGQAAADKVAGSWAETGHSFNLADQQVANLQEKFESLTEEAVPGMAALMGVSQDAVRAMLGFGPANESLVKVNPTIDELTNKMAEFYEETVAVNAAMLGLSQEAYRALTGGGTQEFLAKATENTAQWGQSLEEVQQIMQTLGIAADSTLGSILGGLTNITNVTDKLAKGGGLGKLFSSFTDKGGKTGFAGIANMASNIVGGIGMAIQAGQAALKIGKAIKGLFSKSPVERAAETAGRELGFEVSKELAQAISDTAEKLDIGTFEATFLHLSEGIMESGKSAREFGAEIEKLMILTANGSIPAAEGIAEIGESFSMVREEAERAGIVGDRVTVSMLKMARANGLMTDEMKEFVAASLDLAATGIDKVMEGLFKTGANKEAWSAGGALFGEVFWAAVKEKGIVGAADMLRGTFDKLPKEMQKLMPDIAGIMGMTKEGTLFRRAADAAQGLSEVMKGLADSGYLTAESFKNFGTLAMQAFGQAKEAGADDRQAIQAILPYLQNAVSAAEQYGYTLDENTQKLVDQAKTMGFSFPTDPMLAMLDVLTSIAEVLGADIPESAKRAGEAIRNIPAPPSGVTTVANVAAGEPPPKFAQGGLAIASLPTDQWIRAHKGESVDIRPPGHGRAGDSPITFTIPVDARGSMFNPRQMEEAAQRGVRKALVHLTDGRLRTAISEVKSSARR